MDVSSPVANFKLAWEPQAGMCERIGPKLEKHKYLGL